MGGEGCAESHVKEEIIGDRLVEVMAEKNYNREKVYQGKENVEIGRRIKKGVWRKRKCLIRMRTGRV